MKIINIFLIVMSFMIYGVDHKDGSALTDPSTDITGMYAWLQNKNQVNLIMNVYPNANTASKFSEQTSYVFHVSSSDGYGQPQTRKRLVCHFNTQQLVTCLIEQDVMISEANASSTQGATSDDGQFRIFAGLRNDPSFKDTENFELARTYIRDSLSGFTLDNASCPDVDSTTSSTAINTLSGSFGGVAGTNVPGTDSFVNANILSIVIQVSRSKIGDGPFYSVWGSTNVR